MKVERNFFLIITFLLSLNVFAQNKYTLSGYIKDAGTTEELIGANVVIKELTKGVSTNGYGYYILELPKGKYTIEYSFIGYETKSFTIDITENIVKNVKLKESDNILDELVLEDKKEDANVRSVEIGTIKLTPKTLKKIPVVLGEQDLVKSLTLLPGVTTAREGANGFNVRGGKVDQNLILIDESFVFNSSHLSGFFSIFNSDAIKEATLHKGGIPAEYGGRLSSVLDIRQKEGNNEEFHGKGGVGLLSTRLMLEGPIKKEKASFMVAGRRSYADLFLPLVGNEQIKDSKFYFYDFNAKANWSIDDKNKVFASGYLGRDVISFSEAFSFDWGNKNLSLRWNHIITPKLFLNTSLIYSKYNYNLTFDTEGVDFLWKSAVQNLNLKTNFSYFLNEDNTLKFGLDIINYNFDLGEVSGGLINSQLGKRNGLEPSIYLSNESKVGSRWMFDYGLRLNSYLSLGKQAVGLYENDEPIYWDNKKKSYISRDTIGEKIYNSGEVIASSVKLLPRLRARYTLDENSSLKLGYNRMVQNVHLISNSTSPTPVNIWLPNGKYIKPEMADQISLGYFRNFKDNMFEFSLETYYKYLSNVIDYKDLARLTLNPYIETQMLPGVGRSYGLEFYLKKNKGKFTGWLSYTLSKTELKIEGFGGEGETGINNGDWYSASYDKPHDLTLTLMYDLSKRLSVSGNFVFASGIPTNYPVAGYDYQGHTLPVFDGKRNSERIDNYYRFDVSAIYNLSKNEDKKIKSDLVFGIYNVFNRYNAASLTFRNNAETGQNEAVQTTFFGIIPSITWNFEF